MCLSCTRLHTLQSTRVNGYRLGLLPVVVKSESAKLPRFNTVVNFLFPHDLHEAIEGAVVVYFILLRHIVSLLAHNGLPRLSGHDKKVGPVFV